MNKKVKKKIKLDFKKFNFKYIINLFNKNIISKIFIFSIVFLSIITIFLYNTYFLKNEDYSSKNICSIHYDTLGGTTFEKKQISCGSSLEKLEVPKKEGFEFSGWNFEEKEFDLSSRIDKDIILVAKWKPLKDTKIVYINFDTNGGDYIQPLEVKAGTSISGVREPIKKGYKFLEWLYENKKFNFTIKIEKDLILKAKWEKYLSSNVQKNLTTTTKIDTLTTTKVDISTTTKIDTSATTKVTTTIPVSSINLNKFNIYIYKGDFYKITAKISPSNATNKNIIWSSSDISIATVDNDGNITAKHEGSAKIWAKTIDGNYSAHCSVIVKKPLTAEVVMQKYSVYVSRFRKYQYYIAISIKASGGAIEADDTFNEYKYTFEVYKDGIYKGTYDKITTLGYSNGIYKINYTVTDYVSPYREYNTISGSKTFEISDAEPF